MKRFVLILASVLLTGPAAAQGANDRAAEAETHGCLSSWTDPVSGEDLCVREATFNLDLCTGIEHLASARAVPTDFFARLIWRESLFRPGAVSPKGAEGIAQFMPGTAQLRGLDNSFDILPALEASARYLRELKDRFGSYGLAAAAYNAGEARLSSFLSSGSLPLETRAYVLAITGYPAERWKDDPPEEAAAPLAKDKPFLESCVALAESRKLSPGAVAGQGSWTPWGVQLAAHLDPDVARRLFAQALSRLPAPLREEQPVIVPQKRGNFGYRTRYAARIGRETRAEAQTLCDSIKGAGGACSVWRN
ncbi:MAG: transglycosylase SLT domain-containing protein [Pseudorhizobium sp.]